MNLVVIASDEQRAEWAGLEGKVNWLKDIANSPELMQADAVIDLAFVHNSERINLLSSLLPKPVIVNSVVHTLAQLHPSFVRINGWPGFRKLNIVEAVADESRQPAVQDIFQFLGMEVQWVPDIPGMLAPRVVSMIINEAKIALEENLATAADINTAMKLGTNYPYGPFEWLEKIGEVQVNAVINSYRQKA